ncbi:hypothetical protein [Neorhodopirellula pilleata]|uniref:Uncharacterized protein n=1 Tax=Neorhodopirellula pilleata TaxID=2714738 RepID=A0A5C5ZTS1_9BACT|nr:hypothetical protein [Neorhodopirellula pilleata]TWT89553.1 hypothetical protein Pla100_54820 [Neorhodopirellula pilleata]
MTFAPQHDYKAYNSAIMKRSQKQDEPNMEEKFRRYADYYNTLFQSRRKLASPIQQNRQELKKEKIETHANLVRIFRSLERIRDGK